MPEEVLRDTQETVELPKEDQELASTLEVSDDIAEKDSAPEPEENINIRALRASKRNLEIEKEEMARKLKEYESRFTESRFTESRENKQADAEEYSLDPNDFVEGKHLSKVDKEVRALKAELKGYQQQTAATSTELKLKAQFSDFDEVVSKENIEALSATFPEIAKTLSESNDLYSKAVSAYTLIKKFGINMKDPYKEEKEAINKNYGKPRSSTGNINQGSMSPLSQASSFENGLTDDLKQKLYREMVECSKN